MDKRYSVAMEMTYHGNVYVIANDEEEARKKANAGEWSDTDSLPELVDWEIRGNVQVDE